MADDEHERDTPWRTHEIPRGGDVEIRVGPLHLGVREHAGEVRLTHRLEGEPQRGEPEWARFAPPSWDRTLTLRPAFPDRPVVVAPEDPFRLLAGAEARVYVRLALFAVLQVPGRSGAATLATLPTVAYSDTWWGTPVEGELAYWLDTTARRMVDPGIFDDHLAVCPLRLVNRSEGDLDVDKIALRSGYLSLWARERRMWADETLVSYQGDAEGSMLDVAGTAPLEEPDAGLVLEPRERMARGFRSRTFARFRSLHPWA